MNKYLLKTLLLVFLGLFVNLQAQQNNDFKIIQERIAKMVSAEDFGKIKPTKVDAMLKSMKPNGSWDDIDYKNEDMVNWMPQDHLRNVEVLAVAYTLPESQYYNNPTLLKAITSGLEYWNEVQPKSKNWWHNDINAPKLLGRILLVMDGAKKGIPQDLKNKIVALMEKAPSPTTRTGANKLDIAMHNIYRAAATQDAKLMKFAADEAFQPVRLTDEEGIQYDYSYQQHGPQLHISSYGQVFLSGTYMVASWLVNTPFALSPEKSEILNKYFFGTYVAAVRGRYIDFNTEGRRISRPNSLDKEKLERASFDESFLDYVELVAGEKYQKQLADFRKRISEKEPPSYGIKPKNVNFWKGDYVLHIRPEYSFNVRTNSTRTKRTERGNNENLLAATLSDGSTDIQVEGDEYFNIFPAWEWDKVPGVTSRDYAEDLEIPKKKEWGIDGTTDFVGGVSDGLYGAAVYTQNYDDVLAKKGYFFFDKSIVCLGADINSEAPEKITTTLNQTWSKGDVYVSVRNRMRKFEQGSAKIKTNGIWHRNVLYLLEPNTELNISNKLQKGEWGAINRSKEKEKPVSGKVFKIWLDHGKSPKNANYDYIVVPGVNQKALTANKVRKQINILANNGKIQAVENKALKVLQVIFYEPGELKAKGWKVKVNQPCVVMINAKDKKISVADPSHKLKNIKIDFAASKSCKTKSINVELPQDHYLGKTVTQDFK
ncbi:chondroitinase [Ornithobacterium rhinotracheale]|uniref:polysaccharide lyase family 8 super-sandwich domain-containing protein n=1 Tax=Ornithobacterium rhinotracheale TaxID=28251 RepID=UPI00129C145D|nr:polysaccharide lyase family 8 super-sandwich domain-containing protein [Ornithobacterium rhinotracheale]MRJ07564.1 chondroitinase [Ornithobacterium rhinotracheale]UOH78160.1 polysaccharide lyase beta-sandwich domain-containing protein [Ornithobacterium rhinotracheale]